MPPSLPRALLVTATAALLAACGGGSDPKPAVNGFQVQSMMFGKAATFYVGGVHLRNTMVADTGGACTNPSFASSSTPELAVLNCTVERVGEFPLTLRSAEGAVLYQTTLTVPKPQVAMLTDAGNITLELDPAAAPVTVRNFLTYVGNGYYRSTLFHRVIPGFVVQGGGYTTGMVKKPGQLAPITLESNNGLRNVRGSVAMARTSAPDSATSEFFINLVDNTSLDYRSASNPGYAVFGAVTAGLDVVDTIAAKPTGTFNGFNDVPLTDITITLALQVK
ncbi:peptidylprolyl isomerase [Ramlibacter sp. MAHUQ-53]|uniref:peptidylprolyl isomerase n=1 Tax=unclassified Ramlibacter TaxID=2617605 RepID=UPI003636751F